MNAPDCIFCRISNGEIPAQIVHQDDDVIAFNDVEPQAPVHILIIPRQHVAGLLEVPADSAVLGRLQQVAVSIARDLGLDETGFRLVTNCGADGGQSVFHLHLHLLGGRALAWPPG